MSGRRREGTMKKKLLGLVACAATLALSGALLAGCAGSGGNDEAADNNAASTDKTTLTVGFDQSYPPYGFVGDDGKYTGFDLDLAQAVCDKNGWSFEATPIDWDAKDALLSQGNINCIWNGFTMEGREDGYTFSDPYMLNEQVVVVKAGSDISDFAGLSGKTVMTQVDSAALDVLEGDQAEVAATFKGGAAQTIGDYNNAFMQLDSGMIDAVACDLSIAQYQISANPGKYVQLETPLSTEHYAVGFKKGNTELANQVTETLKQLDADGTVKKLCEKYASYGISYDNWVLDK